MKCTYRLDIIKLRLGPSYYDVNHSVCYPFTVYMFTWSVGGHKLAPSTSATVHDGWLASLVSHVSAFASCSALSLLAAVCSSGKWCPMFPLYPNTTIEQ